MTLAHQGTGAVLEANRTDRKTEAVAAKGHQQDLTEVIEGDTKDARRLARLLRDEWRRERYSRLTGG